MQSIICAKPKFYVVYWFVLFSICNYSNTKYYLTESLQVESELREKRKKEKIIQCKR
jgi:hypothetical protein